MELQFRTEPVVELLDWMGGDHTVVSAARVSTSGTSRGPASDAGLINRLMADRHGSCFEAVVGRFHIETSIMVARESHRHRMASISEASLRYIEGEPVVYVPGPERHLVQLPGTKQMDYVTASGTDAQRQLVDQYFVWACEEAWSYYQDMLKHGVLREVARGVLPLCFGTRWQLTMNARSLMNFLSLRVNSALALKPSHPQYEIEQVAQRMEDIFAEKMPITRAAFVKNGRLAP